MNLIYPYPMLEKDFNDGLEFMIHNIPNNPNVNVNDVNKALVNFLRLRFSFVNDTLNDIELNSYLPLALNAYVNYNLEGVSPNLYPTIKLILKNLFLVPPLQIEQLFQNIGNDFSTSNFTIRDLIQFFLAGVGNYSFSYWLKQIQIGQQSKWVHFLDKNYAVNIANLPYWVSATMQAALYFTFKGNYFTNQSQPPKISGPEYVNALAASLGVTACKVIFKTIPNI